MSRRSENLRFKVMPDRNIRAYQGDTEDKRGVSEMMLTFTGNEAPTLTVGNITKIYLIYETI